MKKTIIAVVALMALATVASAASLTVNYGWEDGNTILGNYGAITANNVSSPVNSGSASLELVDGGASGTPQAYVGWIEGLANGDTVTASFYCYDTTPGSSPSGRIWGHYTSGTIDDYAGSASGNYDYGSGEGWSQLSYTWTFDAGTDRTGLVIEARTYSGLGDTVWVDDLQITVNSNENFTIHTPGGSTTVPEPGSMAALATGLVGLVGVARKVRK